MNTFSAVITLFLIMDPVGNIPVFLSVLKDVPPERRRMVLVREVLFAYVVLLAFLFLGKYILQLLSLRQETISVAGGIVLFLIALKMIFPQEGGIMGDKTEGEPFLVPLAIPFVAGPSTLASLLLLQSSTSNTWQLFLAVTIAWSLTALILVSSTSLYRLLKEKGLIAMERLMGMLLVMLSVQMFLDGIAKYLRP